MAGEIPLQLLQEMQRQMQEMRVEMAAIRAERGLDRSGPSGQSVNVETINSRSVEDEMEGVDGRHRRGRGPGSQNVELDVNEDQNPNINGHVMVEAPDQAEGLHPFTAQVMRAVMPDNKVLPAMEKYGGDTDPVKHLRSFIDAMTVYSSNERVWCRVFSLSLKGEALDWFHSLQTQTVDSFTTLRQMFTRQYASNRTPTISYTALIRMRQGKDEPLKMFMERFNKAARQVHNADQRLIVGALTTALKPGPFVDYLYAEEPQTMEELQNRLASCIRVEEARAQQRGGGEDDRVSQKIDFTIRKSDN